METGENRVYDINLSGSPSSCIIKIENRKYRSLVDTGAEISLINEKVIAHLKYRPDIKPENVRISSVSGDLVKVLGKTELEIKIGKTKIKQEFRVVKNINHNIILGQDWVFGKGVRIYGDLGCIRINGHYVPLEHDFPISSLVRIARDTVINQTCQIYHQEA